MTDKETKLAIAVIIAAAALLALVSTAIAGSAAMPNKVALIVCKTVEADTPPDQNAKWTGLENRIWAIKNSMMQCRRQEIMLQPADPADTFNEQKCQRASLMLGVQWDQAHRSSAYRFWRVACPVPIINTITHEIIGWKLPDCGRRDVIHCEDESEA